MYISMDNIWFLLFIEPAKIGECVLFCISQQSVSTGAVQVLNSGPDECMTNW